jgi:hypothetical protein
MRTINRSPRGRLATAERRDGTHNNIRPRLVFEAVIAEYIRDISDRPRRRRSAEAASGIGSAGFAPAPQPQMA